jgi:hypothetical protein
MNKIFNFKPNFCYIKMDKEKQRDALVEYVKSMQMQEQQKMLHQLQQTNDFTLNSHTVQNNTSCFSNILVRVDFCKIFTAID